jgi:hypothetical protein
MTSERPQGQAAPGSPPVGVEQGDKAAFARETEGTAGMRRAPLRRRLVLLMVCLASGLGIGYIGWQVTAHQEWFLAVPIALLLGWLAVADPEQCVPPRDRRHEGAARRTGSPAAMNRDVAFPVEGGCTCRAVRYSLAGKPLFVHCCHCRWCQRETGSAFVLNAMIEADRLSLLHGEIERVHTPSASGKGQQITRCTRCHVALWSNYAGAGEAVHFVRVGTLDDPDRFPPDVHIYTSSKQPWVVIPDGTPAFAEFYDLKAQWPRESLERRAALLARHAPSRS